MPIETLRKTLLEAPEPISDAVRGLRAAWRRRRTSRDLIRRVSVIVVPPSSASGTTSVSSNTRSSIARTVDAMGDREVSVEIVAGDGESETALSGPGDLWLFVVDGAELDLAALSILVEVFDANADLDMAYSDAGAGTGSDADAGTGSSDLAAVDADMWGPWLLPGFSPDRLADQFYLGHMVAVRPRHLRPSGGWATIDGVRTAPEVLQPMAEAARRVAHLPMPLYTPAPDAGMGEPERAARRQTPDLTGNDRPLVSVVIPTNGSTRRLDRGDRRLVEVAVQSVLASDYPRIEIVVVETPGIPDRLVDRLRATVDDHDRPGRTFTAVADDRPFNFSNACNRGAVHAVGEVLVFLNDDTEVIAADWLSHLVGHACRPDVGAVGARLLYEDGRVQHAGIWSRGGHPAHRYEGWPGDAAGYRGALRVTQNCLAVTGACLAVERAKFDLVGGFSPVFPNSYNDVDLCLKLWDRGYRTVVEPRAELFHFEASTRDPVITDDDLAALHDRWRRRLDHDPFDNPNHTAERSEEWPLPASRDRRSSDLDVIPEPRFWPLEPSGRFGST